MIQYWQEIDMDNKQKKILVIIGFVIGIVCLILSFVSDIFLVFGFLIIGASCFGIYYLNKQQKIDSNKNTVEEKAETLQDNKIDNQETPFSKSSSQSDDIEYKNYKELISNNFDISKTKTNFQCSLNVMALKQILENKYFKPEDLKFNINTKIAEFQDLGKRYFVESKFKNFVAIDLETTGLNYENDRIIQIAMVKVINGEIVDKFQSYVNPKRHIKQEASEINGIYDEDVKDEKTIKELFPSILEFINNLPIVAHNIKFDLSFLKNEYMRCFKKELPKYKSICTMKLWRTLYLKIQKQKVPSAKLYTLVLNLLDNDDIIEYQSNKHDAMCDVIATAKVFMKMYDENFKNIE